jgi:UDP-glucose 4-epimerase
MAKTILITGVGGFIGRALARHFTRRGAVVYGVDSQAEDQAELPCLKAYWQMRLPDTDFGRLIGSMRPDLVVHCAGSASVPLSVTDPRTDFFSGPVLTWEVLDAIRLNAPGCRFLFLSSAAVYGCPDRLPIGEEDPVKPISPYGAHKLQSEAICHEFSNLFGVPTASARIFSAFGPGLRRQVFWDLCQQAVTHGRIKAQGTGNESRDFIHVQDICEALAVLEEKAHFAGEVYNLGSGRETSIRELADAIVRNLGLECEVEFSGQIPAGTPLNWRADTTALKELGFVPTISVEDSLRDYVEWCRGELSGVST